MSPRSPEQFDTIRESSKERILDAALLCFSMHGYHGSSVSKIAAEAGISKGLVYNYYESKPDLLKAILNRFFERSMSMIQLNPEWPAKERLRSLIENAFNLVRKERQSYRLLMSVQLQPGVMQELGEFVEILKVRKMNAWESILKELKVPDSVLSGKIFAAILGGATMSYMLLDEGEYELADIKEYLINTYCDEV